MTREYVNQFTGEKRTKGNMDMELALDMLKLSPYIDHAYLFSGDGDFCRLLEEVQDRGVRATVVSSMRTQPNMVSDALRRKADLFLELDDILPNLSGNRQCIAHLPSRVHCPKRLPKMCPSGHLYR